jgi:Leucine-rich repeat (LRR) protein
VESIEQRAFFGLSNLRELSLHGNELTELRADTLTTLTNLQVFSAAFNRLSEIDDALFANSPRLDSIYLQRNQINAFWKCLR